MKRFIISTLLVSLSFSASAKQIIKPKTFYGGDDINIMSTPTGIAIDEQDNIYITETGSNRISKFSAAGERIDTFLEGGRDPGQINSPAEAFYKNGVLYIAELGNDRITRITADGTFIDTVGEGQLIGPRALYVEDNGTMHVIDEFDNTIKVFNAQGEMISSCTNPYFFMPNDIEFDGTYYFVANTSAQTIMKTNASCQFVAMAGEYGVLGYDNDHFNFPRSVKLNGDKVYIADSTNNQVKILDKDLNFISVFGGLGVLAGPSSLEVLSTGELAVVSSGESIVKIFDPANTAAASRVVGNYRFGADLMASPNAVEYDKKAKEVYVADTGNSRVLVFDEKKSVLKRTIGQFGYGFNAGDILAVGGIKIAGDYLYAASVYTHEIVVFTKAGEQVARFGTEGTEPGQFKSPYGIETDEAGNIYITELVGARIQKFSSSFEFIEVISTPAYGPGSIFSPFRMELLSNNRMLVTDYFAHKIVELDLTTKAVVNEYGAFGLEEGSLFYPFGITTDKKEKYIIVGEAGNNRLTVLTRDFEFVGTVGHVGTLDDDFFFPSDIIQAKKCNEFLIPNRVRNQIVKIKFKPKKLDKMNNPAKFADKDDDDDEKDDD
ncbi:MAG: hypothetical protein D6B28_04440 [Gammaproteobacteria bacterium]|nr:MAG: hypothetical protein D6B28_04440 [Gammaproteobacteria bacterium]